MEQVNQQCSLLDEKTPLMKACEIADLEAVKILLEEGADTNETRITSSGAKSALHYTCALPFLERQSWQYARLLKAECDKRVPILKMVLEYGGKVSQNDGNLSASGLAAINTIKPLVDVFLDTDNSQVLLDEKIKALELSGVSYLVRKPFSHKEAFESFKHAIQLRRDNNMPITQSNTLLSKKLAMIGKREYDRLDDIEAIKDSKHDLKTHAFLVGERVWPKLWKKEIFLPQLLEHASCFFKLSDHEEGFQMFNYCLDLESKEQMDFGDTIDSINSELDEEIDQEVLKKIPDLISKFADNVVNIDNSTKLDLSWRVSIKERCGTLLFHLSYNQGRYNQSKLNILESVISLVKNIIVHLQSFEKCGVASPPVTNFVMELLGEAFVDCMYTTIPSPCLQRVKFVLSKLVKLEDLTIVNSNGDTVLHITMGCASVARDMDYIESLGKMFVRHGCPINLKNDEDYTPYSILMEGTDGYAEDELIALVSPTMCTKRLEELASRALLQHKIPYEYILPKSLVEVVEGREMLYNEKDLFSSESEGEEENE